MLVRKTYVHTNYNDWQQFFLFSPIGIFLKQHELNKYCSFLPFDSHHKNTEDNWLINQAELFTTCTLMIYLISYIQLRHKTYKTSYSSLKTACHNYTFNTLWKKRTGIVNEENCSKQCNKSENAHTSPS